MCVFVFSAESDIDSCSFRDEDDDCTYYYTVEAPKDTTAKELEVQVLKKKGERFYSIYMFVFTSFVLGWKQSS